MDVCSGLYCHYIHWAKFLHDSVHSWSRSAAGFYARTTCSKLNIWQSTVPLLAGCWGGLREQRYIVVYKTLGTSFFKNTFICFSDSFAHTRTTEFSSQKLPEINPVTVFFRKFSSLIAGKHGYYIPVIDYLPTCTF